MTDTELRNTPLREIFTAHVDWLEHLGNRPVLILRLKDNELARMWVGHFSRFNESVYTKHSPIKVVPTPQEDKVTKQMFAAHGDLHNGLCMYGLGAVSLYDEANDKFAVICRKEGDDTLYKIEDGMGSSRPGYANLWTDTPILDVRIDYTRISPQTRVGSARAISLQVLFDEVAPMLLDDGIRVVPITDDARWGRCQPIEPINVGGDIDLEAYNDRELTVEFSFSTTEILWPKGKDSDTKSSPLFDDCSKHDCLAVMKQIYAHQRKRAESNVVGP